MEGESWGSWLGKGLEAGGGGREWREEEGSVSLTPVPNLSCLLL